ncbi:MAG: hypothetical protein KJO07_19135 [Deltaproteobacteria bacterium]|nr:hypothetical protein [Deltaproteobacteria bacterium]
MIRCTWAISIGAASLIAASWGCANGEAEGPDAGLGSIFADAGRVPPPPPGSPDAAPKPIPDASVLPDAPLPDAAQLPDAQPAPDAAPGCTDQVVELLVNPGFESGQGPEWNETSGLGVDLVTSDFSSPHQGTHVAWLGGYDSGVDILYQDVAIPAGATDLQIEGWVAVGTEESIGEWDVAALELRTTAGALLETLGEWSNLDADSVWNSFSVVPVGDFQGQTIRLYIRSQHDVSNMTSFVFDTLAVRATVCQ